MRRVLGVITSFIVAIGFVNAQTISGTILDKEDNSSILQATIHLLAAKDSAFITATSTNEKGRFALKAKSPGDYIVKTTYVGYRTLYTNCVVVGTQNTKLNKLYLSLDAVLLSEAEVIGEAPQVVVKEDTLVYAASAYRLPEGSMLEELVKKLPGAEVDSEGKITINGKEIKKIMVDGKEFFTNDPKIASKNLPVNMIENIKAYDRKSDLARITGIDDGQEEAVLDLTVKKGMKQGWFGNIFLGAGNKERYDAGTMINRFTDKGQFSVVSSLNNTNNAGFSEMNGNERRGGGGSSGINATKSLGINFAQDYDKIQFGGSVNYAYSDRDAVSKSATERYGVDGSTYADAVSSNRRKSDQVTSDFRLEWKPDSLTNIIFKPSFSYNNGSNINAGISHTYDTNRDTLTAQNSRSIDDTYNTSVSGDLQLYRRLNRKGRNLTFNLGYGYSNSESDKFTDGENTYYSDVTTIVPENKRFNNYSDANRYSFQASYTEPVFTNRFIQVSYKISNRLSDSSKDTYRLNNATEQYDLVDSLSNSFQNKYLNQQINLSFKTVREKYEYTIGGYFEPKTTKSISNLGQLNENTITRNVSNFSPTVEYRYRFSQQEQLRFRYRGSSQEPSISDLHDIVDSSDTLNISRGNPSLKPKFTNQISINYNNYIQASQRGIMMFIDFSNTLNDITNQVTYDPKTGGKTSIPVNINGNWNANGSFGFNTPFKNKQFTIGSFSRVSFANQVGLIGDREVANKVTKTTTQSWNLMERIRAGFRNQVVDAGVNSYIRYQTSNNSFQPQANSETYNYGFGGNLILTLPWDLSVSNDADFQLKRGYTGGLNTDEIIWNMQLSKNFLSQKQATLRIKFYDLLQQRTNISRNVTAMSSVDSETNTLNSYFMVHFVYRINSFGKSVPKNRMQSGDDQPRRPGGGGRGFGRGGM